MEEIFVTKVRINICWLLIFLCSYPSSAQLDAKQVFDKMLKTYAEATTYQDFGTVTTTIRSQQSNLKTQLIFRTAYQRPTEQFRFAYLDEKLTRFAILDQKCYVIWSDGKVIKTWWDIGNRQEQYPQLSQALSAATGVSGTSSRKIPGLLLKEPILAGWEIRQLNQLVILSKTEKIKSSECYHLVAMIMRANQKLEIDIWIDTQTYLIKQIKESDNAKVTKILEYDSIVDAPIAPKYLNFNPQDCLCEK